MKFLHTSDWHLGMMFRGGISYAADQRYAIENICRIANEEKVDGILLAGDIFDRSIASGEALLLYDEIITHICLDLKIPVFVIAGNHDGAQRLSQCSRLLKKSSLYIAGALTGEVQVVRSGDTDVYLLPWISTDRVKSVYPDRADEIGSLEDAYGIVLDEYRSRFIEGHTNILVAHAFIADASTSVSDRSAEVGSAAMVGAQVFEGFDYVALGHLHGPQSVGDNIRYSGSPVAYSFGREEKQTKSVVIYDTGLKKEKLIAIPQLHKRTTLTGTFDELINADFDEDTLNGYVKLEVTDSYVGMDSIAAFRERYPNLLEITGKSFDHEEAVITMTIDELESAETDPESVFVRYCRDIMQEEPDDHLQGLFYDALVKYEKEVSAG